MRKAYFSNMPFIRCSSLCIPGKITTTTNYGQDKVDRYRNQVCYFSLCCFWTCKAWKPPLAQIKLSISKRMQYLTGAIHQHGKYFKITYTLPHNINMTFNTFKTSPKKVNYSPKHCPQDFFKQLMTYRHNDDLTHFNHIHYYKYVRVLNKYKSVQKIFIEIHNHIIRCLLDIR